MTAAAAAVGHAAAGLDHAVREPMPAPADWDLSHVSFSDVLSVVNPLQYLPVVGTIYRAVTGDDVHPAFRIAVSGVAAMLFGGPIGLAATMLMAGVDEIVHGGPTTADTAHRAMLASRAYGGQLARSA